MKPLSSSLALSLTLAAALIAGCEGNSVVGGQLDPPADVPTDIKSLPDAAETAVPDVVDVPELDAVDVPEPDVVDVSDVVDVPADDGPSGCARDMDCAGNPAGATCDLVTGRCVQCVPSNDTCPAAQHCDTATNTCVAGCRNDEGCAMATGDGGAPPRRCDTALHACVECAEDAHCGGGRLCRGNVCVAACSVMGCPTGQQCCDGACIDVTSNASSCGACGTVCAAPNATPACRMGACAVGMCGEGYADCDGAPSNGCETDVRVSATSCGGCGRECTGAPNATPACRMGTCGFTCAEGFGDCDGMAANGCETDLRTTLGHCGMCGNRCANPANGTAACVMGACGVATCNAGFGDCDRSATNGCEVSTSTSESHCGMCGNACPTGQVCNAGRCEIPCPRGLVNCNGECVALAYDPENCGRCGNRCTLGALCGAGLCVAACGAGQVTCAGGCTNTQTDPENCGACGTVCPPGNACQMGACRVACVTGQVVCNGACVNLMTNLQNCGACNNTCGAGEQCMAGRCTLTCRAPQVVCGAECAELSRDPNHCGACGRVCPTGCFEGACARIDTLEAGTFNNCARYTSGRVYCWGLHTNNGTAAQGMLTAAGGQYGHRVAPVQVLEPTGTPLEGVEQVVMGSNRACARGNGAVRCWGYGVAMGAVSGLPSVTALAAREANFCALGADGRVYCWDGQPRAATAPALTPAVTLPSAAVEVVTGTNFACARLMDRTVMCWGPGTSGQLGNGASTNSATTPVAVRGLTDAEQLSAGGLFACARRTSGAITCWGANSDGQLGDGSTTNRNVSVAVTGLTGTRLVRAGLRHACAIIADGTLRCWGDNTQGQLGDGTTTDRTAPVAVAGLLDPQMRVAAYDHHTCAVAMDRRVMCWGYNPYGEAGGGTELVAAPQPVQLMGSDLTGITDLQVGQAVTPSFMATTQWKCALHTDGRVFCWGTRSNGNESGQLGDGTTTQRALPAPVTGLTDATQIAVGWLHACALRRNNTVVCWGSNAQGQLGDGTTTNRTTPVAVAGLTNAVEIRAGDYHTCARRMDGSVWCWGYNFYGELGDGTMINRATAAPVMGLSNAAQIESGANYTCARLMRGEVHCWGRNIEGQLGDGFRTNRSLPFPVQASTATATMLIAQTGFTDLRCDYYRCYGHATGGTMLGWGYTFPARAAAVPALATVTYNTRAFTSYATDSECEQRIDGNTYCRGRNEYGQVGVGRASFDEPTFQLISTRFSVIRIGRGYTAPCAVERTTGRVLCWGWTGNDALLATGATGISARPYEIYMP